MVTHFTYDHDYIGSSHVFHKIRINNEAKDIRGVGYWVYLHKTGALQAVLLKALDVYIYI